MSAQDTRSRWFACQWLLYALVGTSLLALLEQPLLHAAATGTVQRFSSLRYVLDVDNRWSDGPGYRPIRCTVRTIKPPAADTVLELRITNDFGYGYQSSTSAQKKVTLPAGAATVSFTINVPQQEQLESYSVALYEEGDRVTGLNPPTVYIGGSGIPWDSSSSVMLEVNSQGWNLSPNFVGGGLSGFQAPPTDLPDDWIGYTGIDMVVFSLEEFRGWPQQPSAKRQALSDWVQSGGQLLIYDLPKSLEGTKKIHQILKLPGEDIASDEGFLPSGWNRAPDKVSGFFEVSNEIDLDLAPESEELTISERPRNRWPTATRQLGLGYVIVMAGDDSPNKMVSSMRWRDVAALMQLPNAL